MRGSDALLSLAPVAACSDGTSPRPLIFRYKQILPGGAYGSGYGAFIIDLHTYVYRAVP